MLCFELLCFLKEMPLKNLKQSQVVADVFIVEHSSCNKRNGLQGGLARRAGKVAGMGKEATYKVPSIGFGE